MQRSKFLITTYCNRFKGDFLIDHWLYSLQQHVSLNGIDILVIDFGLSDEQRNRLLKQGVILRRETPEGRMSNIHYKYLAQFLSEHPQYEQVLYSDCGDLVFQADISGLFEVGCTRFKAVQEPEFNFNLHSLTLGLQDVMPEKIPLIKKTLGNAPIFNCGFVMGPADKMGRIWSEYCRLCSDTQRHGTDQLIINYLLYSSDAEILPRKFNYVLFLNDEAYGYDEQRMLINKDGIIPVVHNAGRYDFARTVQDFGYKTGKMRRWMPHFFLWGYRVLRGLTTLNDQIRNRVA